MRSGIELPSGSVWMTGQKSRIVHKKRTDADGALENNVVEKQVFARRFVREYIVVAVHGRDSALRCRSPTRMAKWRAPPGYRWL